MRTISQSSEELISMDEGQNVVDCDVVWGGADEYGASSNPSSKNDMQPFVNLP